MLWMWNYLLYIINIGSMWFMQEAAKVAKAARVWIEIQVMVGTFFYKTETQVMVCTFLEQSHKNLSLWLHLVQ